MSIKGRWRIVETPGWEMAVAGAFIRFDGEDGGEFALHCLTGFIDTVCEGDGVDFDWRGHDEMDPAQGDGWAELQYDGSLEGEICLTGGDDIPFIAHRLETSSTAC